jgi:hypothetical protein
MPPAEGLMNAAITGDDARHLITEAAADLQHWPCGVTGLRTGVI